MVPSPIKTTNKNPIPKVRQKRATQLIRHPYYSIAGISSHEVLIISRIRIQGPVLISDTWFGIQFFESISGSGMPTDAVILRWPDNWTSLRNSHSCSASRGYRQESICVCNERKGFPRILIVSSGENMERLTGITMISFGLQIFIASWQCGIHPSHWWRPCSYSSPRSKILHHRPWFPMDSRMKPSNSLTVFS